MRLNRYIEKAYSALPTFVQNAGITAFGLYWRWERLGGDFPRLVSEFRTRDSWTRQQMEEYETRALRQILCGAFDSSPYYRESWTSIGFRRSDMESMLPADLHNLPILTKRAFRECGEALLSRDFQGRRGLRTYHTSGSTGQPTEVRYTVALHRRYTAAREVRSFGWAGTSLLASRATFSGRMVVPRSTNRPPFSRINLSERQVYFSSHHLSPANVGYYVEVLNRHRPEVITGYAGVIGHLSRLMHAHRLRLDYAPKAAILVGEKSSAEVVDIAAESLNCRVFEEYGCVENCVLVTQCEYGSLHLSSDFGLVEILDDAGKPLGPERIGRIVCTSLLNSVQPLIRYEIGDLGMWGCGSCACGRDQFPVLKEVVGRVGETLVSADGRFIGQIHGIFTGLQKIFQAQIIQREVGRLLVKVVPMNGFSDVERTLILRRITDRLGNIEVDFRLVNEIPRELSGKFRPVINELPEDVKSRLLAGRSA